MDGKKIYELPIAVIHKVSYENVFMASGGVLAANGWNSDGADNTYNVDDGGIFG